MSETNLNTHSAGSSASPSSITGAEGSQPPNADQNGSSLLGGASPSHRDLRGSVFLLPIVDDGGVQMKSSSSHTDPNTDPLELVVSYGPSSHESQSSNLNHSATRYHSSNPSGIPPIVKSTGGNGLSLQPEGSAPSDPIKDSPKRKNLGDDDSLLGDDDLDLHDGDLSHVDESILDTTLTCESPHGMDHSPSKKELLKQEKSSDSSLIESCVVTAREMSPGLLSDYPVGSDPSLTSNVQSANSEPLEPGLDDEEMEYELLKPAVVLPANQRGVDKDPAPKSVTQVAANCGKLVKETVDKQANLNLLTSLMKSVTEFYGTEGPSQSPQNRKLDCPTITQRMKSQNVCFISPLLKVLKLLELQETKCATVANLDISEDKSEDPDIPIDPQQLNGETSGARVLMPVLNMLNLIELQNSAMANTTVEKIAEVQDPAHLDLPSSVDLPQLFNGPQILTPLLKVLKLIEVQNSAMKRSAEEKVCEVQSPTFPDLSMPQLVSGLRIVSPVLKVLKLLELQESANKHAAEEEVSEDARSPLDLPMDPVQLLNSPQVLTPVLKMLKLVEAQDSALKRAAVGDASEMQDNSRPDIDPPELNEDSSANQIITPVLKIVKLIETLDATLLKSQTSGQESKRTQSPLTCPEILPKVSPLLKILKLVENQDAKLTTDEAGIKELSPGPKIVTPVLKMLKLIEDPCFAKESEEHGTQIQELHTCSKIISPALKMIKLIDASVSKSPLQTDLPPDLPQKEASSSRLITPVLRIIQLVENTSLSGRCHEVGKGVETSPELQPGVISPVLRMVRLLEKHADSKAGDTTIRMTNQREIVMRARQPAKRLETHVTSASELSASPAVLQPFELTTQSTAVSPLLRVLQLLDPPSRQTIMLKAPTGTAVDHVTSETSALERSGTPAVTSDTEEEIEMKRHLLAVMNRAKRRAFFNAQNNAAAGTLSVKSGAEPIQRPEVDEDDPDYKILMADLDDDEFTERSGTPVETEEDVSDTDASSISPEDSEYAEESSDDWEDSNIEQEATPSKSLTRGSKVMKIVTRSGSVCYLKVPADEVGPAWWNREPSAVSPPKVKAMDCLGCGTRLKGTEHHECVENFCRFCQLQLASRPLYELHMVEDHLKMGVGTCPFCEDTPPTSQLLQTHLRMHTVLQLAPSVCVGCHLQFHTVVGREVHTCSAALLCTPCNQLFDSSEQLEQHTLAQHKDPEEHLPGTLTDQSEDSREPIVIDFEKEETEELQQPVLASITKSVDHAQSTPADTSEQSASGAPNIFECDICDLPLKCVEDLIAHRNWHYESCAAPASAPDVPPPGVPALASPGPSAAEPSLTPVAEPSAPADKGSSVELNKALEEAFNAIFAVIKKPECEDENIHGHASTTGVSVEEKSAPSVSDGTEDHVMQDCEPDAESSVGMASSVTAVTSTSATGEGAGSIPPLSTPASEEMDVPMQLAEEPAVAVSVQQGAAEEKEEAVLAMDVQEQASLTSTAALDSVVQPEQSGGVEHRNTRSEEARPSSPTAPELSMTCEICRIHFQNELARENHMIDHHASVDTCPLCQAQFSSSKELVDHVLAHSDVEEAMFKCQFCSVVCKQEAELDRHQCAMAPPLQAGEQRTCHFCVQEFTDRYMYEIHMITKHFIHNECQFCGDKFSSAENLLTHVKAHTSLRIKRSDGPNAKIDEGIFPCQKCDFVFVNVRGLRVHKGIHGLYCELCDGEFDSSEQRQWHVCQNNASPAPENTCAACEQQVFKRVMDYDLHMITEHSSKKFCQFCSQQLPDFSTLLAHVGTHTTIPHLLAGAYPRLSLPKKAPKEVFCRVCKIDFLNRKKYELHMMEEHSSHTACQFCERKFDRTKGLSQHLAIHTKLPHLPYCCSQCGASYGKETQLLLHMCEKTVPCHQCEEMFVTSKELRLHTLDNHGFMCELCPKICTRHSDLLRHITRKHVTQACSKCGVTFPSQAEQYVHTCPPEESVEAEEDAGESSDISLEPFADMDTFEPSDGEEEEEQEKPEESQEMEDEVTTQQSIEMVTTETSEDQVSPKKSLEEVAPEISTVKITPKKKIDNVATEIGGTNSRQERVEVTPIKVGDTNTPEKDVENTLALVSKEKIALRTRSEKVAIQISEDYITPKKDMASEEKVSPQKKAENIKPQISEDKMTPIVSIEKITPKVIVEKITPQTNEGQKTPTKTSEESPRTGKKCPQCDRWFKNRQAVAGHIKHQHLKGDVSPAQHTCGKCKSSFSKQQDLDTHKCPAPRVGVKCKLCVKVFNTEVNLSKHMVARHASVDTCQFCNKKFRMYAELKRHLTKHTNIPAPPLLTCNKCGKFFAMDQDLKSHLCAGVDAPSSSRIKTPTEKAKQLKARATPPVLPRCKVCRRQRFQSAEQLAGHYVEAHSLVELLPVVCALCHTRFAGQRELGTHQCPLPLLSSAWQIRDTLPFIASVCSGPDAQFVVKDEPAVTVKEEVADWPELEPITDIKEEPTESPPCRPPVLSLPDAEHLCLHCSQFFETLALLNEHLCKVNYCKHCRTSFRTSPDFETHMLQKHSSFKLCGFCDQTFTHHTLFRKHIVSHTKFQLDAINTIFCKLCKKNCHNRKAYELHMLSEHDNGLVCQFCDRAFKTKPPLTKHRKIHSTLKVPVIAKPKVTTPTPVTPEKEPEAPPPPQQDSEGEKQREANTLAASNRSHCIMCDKTYASHTIFEYHMMELHLLSRQCQFCGLKFTRRSQLVMHLARHTKIKPKDMMHCRGCDEYFLTEDKFQTHQCSQAAPAPPAPTPPAQPEPTKPQAQVATKKTRGRPPQKGVATRKRVAEESPSPTPSPPKVARETSPMPRSKCLLCAKHFATLDARNTHMRVHHRVDVDSLQQLGSLPGGPPGTPPPAPSPPPPLPCEDEIPAVTVEDDDEFPCQHCGVTFPSAVSLRLHGQRLGVYCEFCQATFPSPKEYEAHMLQRHAMGNTCQFCGAQFSAQAALVIHLQQHTNMEPTSFKCFRCNETFITQIEKNNHPCVAWTCQMCCKRLASEEDLVEHLEEHRAPRADSPVGKVVQCGFCPTFLDNSNALIDHMREVHYIRAARPVPNHSPENTVSQHRNKRRLEPSNEQMAKHPRHSLQPERFSCQGHCARTFASLEQLEQHRRSTYVVCHICSLPFSTVAECEQHRLDCHSFNCDECGQKFEQEVSLINHMACHRIAPHTVRVVTQPVARIIAPPTARAAPQPPPGLRNPPNVLRRIVIKPSATVTSQQAAAAAPPSIPAPAPQRWSCDMCGRQLPSQQSLQLHRREHEVHQCRLCTRVLGSAALLRVHMRQHELQQPPQQQQPPQEEDDDDDVQVVLEVARPSPARGGARLVARGGPTAQGDQTEQGQFVLP